MKISWTALNRAFGALATLVILIHLWQLNRLYTDVYTYHSARAEKETYTVDEAVFLLYDVSRWRICKTEINIYVTRNKTVIYRSPALPGGVYGVGRISGLRNPVPVSTAERGDYEVHGYTNSGCPEGDHSQEHPVIRFSVR